jgi:hypothetical protein
MEDEQLEQPCIDELQDLHFGGVTEVSKYAPSLHFVHELALHYKQKTSVSLQPLQI